MLDMDIKKHMASLQIYIGHTYNKPEASLQIYIGHTYNNPEEKPYINSRIFMLDMDVYQIPNNTMKHKDYRHI